MIRLAQVEELGIIMEIYSIARTYMAENGNPTQWGSSEPPLDLLEQDIHKKQLYVYEKDNEIQGVFAFIQGVDATYSYIENGAWKNDEPYGTIHRIASARKVKGVFRDCLDFCKSQIANIRIDTHKDNLTMQYLIEKNGFEKCGIIYIKNGTPRIAYQWSGN